MVTHVKQSGSILLITLIFCVASSFCLLLLLETSILETIMSRHSYQKKQLFHDYLSSLQRLEHRLENYAQCEFPKGLTFLQWVPDSLNCHESEGIRFYQIDHKSMSPDGASSHFRSTVAVRGSLPKGEAHPNQAYCSKDFQSLLIPLSEILPISALIGEVIIGAPSEEEGALLYVLAQKKYQPGRVLIIVKALDENKLELEKVIDTGTELYPPILRNHKLLINDNDWLMLFDALTGKLLQKEKLLSSSHSAPITENTIPIMQVRKPREAKRLVLCPTSRGWAQAEVHVDYHDLGRRTWQED